MSWGNKLVLVFIGFAALMFTLVYKAMNTKFELVSKTYYEDELRYQDKIDGKQNAAALGSLEITKEAEALKIHLPGELNTRQLEGEAWFYCKIDANKDLRMPLSVDEAGVQTVPLNLLPAHQYQLKLSWVVDGKHYYMEKDIALD